MKDLLKQGLTGYAMGIKFKVIKAKVIFAQISNLFQKHCLGMIE